MKDRTDILDWLKKMDDYDFDSSDLHDIIDFIMSRTRKKIPEFKKINNDDINIPVKL